MKFLTKLLLASLLIAELPAQQPPKKVYDVPGAIELHIYLTAKPGQEKELERIYRDEFYKAVTRQEGFLFSELMRKPNSSEYVLRHTFKSEELRLKWVATPDHEKTFPKLTGLCSATTWQGFGVVYPVPAK